MAGRNSASSANPMLEMAAMMIGRNATINNVNLPPAPMNYAYYPGVTDVSEARPIELPPGAEVNGVDLRLTPKPRTYRVRGRVLDPRTGQPPPRASVAMSPKTLDTGNSLLAQLGVFEEGMPNRNYDAKTGVFDFKDLLPGVYNLMVSGDDPQPDPNAAPRGEGGRSAGQPRKLTATSTIVISQEDVDGLVVSVMPAAAITGQIRVDGSLPQSTSLERMRVMLTSAPTGGSANPLQTTTSSVKPDGGFRLENVAPGDYRVRVMATPGARGGPTPPVNINIYIKEARFEGVDALNMPLRVSGPAAGSFELVVGVGGGQVNGSVLDSRQRPAPVTQVTLIPTRNRDRTDLYKTVTTDENGRFTITDIVPGDYKVFSWESVEPFGWFDPELLSASENSGRPVNVTESSAETIEVRLIAAGGAQ
jgi:hypothetical protein